MFTVVNVKTLFCAMKNKYCQHFEIEKRLFFFLKVGHSRPLFIYFCLFNTVDIKQVNKQMFNKILPMTGVDPRTSGIESERSTN